VIGDSRHTPFCPHGLTGLHNDTTGRPIVVLVCVVGDTVGRGQLVEGNQVVGGSQVEDEVGITMHRKE
jgi:hypothetical protein